MSATDDEGAEGVIGRKLVFCPRLEMFQTDRLIRTCEDCGDFVLYCCPCWNRYKNDGRGRDGRLCHHFRLIFTDGACRQNGQVGATAGAGLACGTDDKSQVSIPITADWDPGQKRTSQRAELLASIAGLRYMVDCDRLNNGEPDEPKREKDKGEKSWIIATDSEYVVKGVTEWLPAWKVSAQSSFVEI